MTDSLERIISASGTVFGIAADTTQLVTEAIRRHDAGPTGAAALGRALTGATLLAGLLKDEQSIRLTFEGNGPLGKIVAEANHNGTCRGYVVNPRADVPFKEGQIDVAGGIGAAGLLRVSKNIGLGDPYEGIVHLYTSEIAGDIAFYLTDSEQTPSTVGIGIHLLPDGTVAAAGGFLIQTLPPPDESIIDALDRAISGQENITGMLLAGKTPGQILSQIFQDVPHKHTGSTPLSFTCSCSEEKMKTVLRSLRSDDLQYLLDQDNGAEINCEFCSSSYSIEGEYLRQILQERKSN